MFVEFDEGAFDDLDAIAPDKTIGIAHAARGHDPLPEDVPRFDMNRLQAAIAQARDEFRTDELHVALVTHDDAPADLALYGANRQKAIVLAPRVSEDGDDG